jgi:sirohydrochlorin cobaltochelatase
MDHHHGHDHHEHGYDHDHHHHPYPHADHPLGPESVRHRTPKPPSKG